MNRRAFLALAAAAIMWTSTRLIIHGSVETQEHVYIVSALQAMNTPPSNGGPCFPVDIERLNNITLRWSSGSPWRCVAVSWRQPF